MADDAFARPDISTRQKEAPATPIISAPMRVDDFQITMLCPDGSKFYIGRPSYTHANPIINATRGVFERWRFERNRTRFNDFVKRYLQEKQ